MAPPQTTTQSERQAKWKASPPLLTTHGEREQKDKNNIATKLLLLQKLPFPSNKNREQRKKKKRILESKTCQMPPLCCLLHTTSQGPSLSQQWQLCQQWWLENSCAWRTRELENLGTRELRSWGSGEPLHVWWWQFLLQTGIEKYILKQLWIVKCSFSGQIDVEYNTLLFWWGRVTQDTYVFCLPSHWGTCLCNRPVSGHPKLGESAFHPIIKAICESTEYAWGPLSNPGRARSGQVANLIKSF